MYVNNINKLLKYKITMIFNCVKCRHFSYINVMCYVYNVFTIKTNI